MNVPTTAEELKHLGWKHPDVILITGDTYIDSPYFGVAVIARVLLDAGYKTAVIAQPDIHSPQDITRLGEPELFWGVTSGCVDSMISNYTASKKPRRSDDLTPGGVNSRRPDRAVIVYANLIRRYFKNTKPIVLGGIEASLRRISHYDYWSDSVKRSVLFDAKADFLIYGMGEKTVLELAEALRKNEAITAIRGLCYISKTLPKIPPAPFAKGGDEFFPFAKEGDEFLPPLAKEGDELLPPLAKEGDELLPPLAKGGRGGLPQSSFLTAEIPPAPFAKGGDAFDKGGDAFDKGGDAFDKGGGQSSEFLVLNSHKAVSQDKQKFIEMFKTFYENTDPFTAVPLYQQQDTRYLVQNPPQFPLSGNELDKIFELPYTRDVHPYYKKQGQVRAMETIKFSLTTHRGCYGECRFCAIAVHQGRTVSERTEASLLKEAADFTADPDFKGIIYDVGGPTANMYGIECEKKKTKGGCRNRSCLFPAPCKHLPVNHSRQIRLLEKLRKLPKIKNVFIGSGIRYDLILWDEKFGTKYLEQLIRHHVSGQMKIAPEHSEDKVLKQMGKPGADVLKAFKKRFDAINQKIGKKQFLTYYFIAAHPGCALEDMNRLRQFVKKELRLLPEQVQIFTPSPSTYSTLMYYTGTDPFANETIFVEKNMKRREKQKAAVMRGT